MRRFTLLLLGTLLISLGSCSRYVYDKGSRRWYGDTHDELGNEIVRGVADAVYDRVGASKSDASLWRNQRRAQRYVEQRDKGRQWTTCPTCQGARRDDKKKTACPTCGGLGEIKL